MINESNNVVRHWKEKKILMKSFLRKIHALLQINKLIEQILCHDVLNLWLFRMINISNFTFPFQYSFCHVLQTNNVFTFHTFYVRKCHTWWWCILIMILWNIQSDGEKCEMFLKKLESDRTCLVWWRLMFSCFTRRVLCVYLLCDNNACCVSVVYVCVFVWLPSMPGSLWLLQRNNKTAA